jgi:uncharacterized membrane protein
MESRAKLLGHPIHPMLVVFPLGLLSTAAIFDIIGLMTENAGFFQASFWMILAGVIGGLTAAVFGTADWLAIPRGTRARRIGLWHGLGNVVMVTLFAASWVLRRDTPMSPPQVAVVFSMLGLGLGGLTGWLGGELVDRLGVGVDEGANLDAPSSLSKRPARGTPLERS